MLKDIIDLSENKISPKTKKIVENLSKNVSLDAEQDIELEQDIKTKIYRDITIKETEIRFEQHTLKETLNNFVSTILNLEKTKFKYNDKIFNDWGIINNTLYHIFYIINNNYDINEFKKIAYTRILYCINNYDDNKIVVCNLLENKLELYNFKIDSFNIKRIIGDKINE